MSTSIVTRLPSLDAAVPMETGQLHLRLSGNYGHGLTSLARTTAVDLHAVMPVLLATGPGADLAELTDSLSRLGLPSGARDFVVLSAFDFETVLEALADLESRTGRAPALVVEDFSSLTSSPAVAQPSSSSPVRGTASVLAGEFLNSLRPLLGRGGTAVLHVRTHRRLAGGSDGVPRALRFSAHTITELRREPSSGLVVATGQKCANASPFRRAHFATFRGVAFEPVPDLSMSVELLRAFGPGQVFLADALKSSPHLDSETLAALDEHWLGSLEELLATLSELGPDVLSSAQAS